MKRDDLIDTIRRLLALGQSPNEHEAAAALAKAAELLARHNVTQEDLTARSIAGDWTEETVDHATRQPAGWRQLCAIVREFFFVDVIRHRQDDGRTKLIFFGRSHHCQIARYVFGYLRQQFHSLAAARRIPRKDRDQYYTGLAMSIVAKLRDAQKARQAAGDNSLVALANELEAAADRFYGKLKNDRCKVKDPCATNGALWAGMHDGRQINIATAIDKTEQRNSIEAQTLRLEHHAAAGR